MGSGFVQMKSVNRHGMFSQQIFNRFSRTITNTQPDKLRRAAIQKTSLLEVRVFGNNHKTIHLRIRPNSRVIGVS